MRAHSSGRVSVWMGLAGHVPRGRFTGRVLLWSPRERSVSCHTPVAAALDLVALDSFEVDEQGDMIAERAQRQLREDFKRQIWTAASRGLSKLVGPD